MTFINTFTMFKDLKGNVSIEKMQNIFKKSHGFLQVKMQYVKLKNPDGVNRKLKERSNLEDSAVGPF